MLMCKLNSVNDVSKLTETFDDDAFVNSQAREVLSRFVFL